MSTIPEEGPDGGEATPFNVRPGSELKALAKVLYDLVVFLEGFELLTDDEDGFLSNDVKPRAEQIVRQLRGR